MDPKREPDPTDDVPDELEEAAAQNVEYPADETDEG
jgi:hypothetical protein